MRMEKSLSTEKSREFTANLFIERLQKTVKKKIFMQVILAMFLFTAGFFFVTCVGNELNAEKNLVMLKEFYLKLYDQSMEFLNDEKTIQAYLQKHEDPSSQQFLYEFNRFNTKSVIGNQVILSDEDGVLIDATFAQNELSDYLLDYNRAICYNVKNSGRRDVYVAVYFDTGNYSDYMFVKPVYVDDRLVGYISLFLIGVEWNFYLSDKNYDGIIVDDRNNVIYRSKAGFANQSGKCYPQTGRICTYNDDRYWVKSERLTDYGVSIYSLIYYPNNNILYVGMLTIMIFGLIWYNLANWMSHTMAEYNASQISQLVKEIRQIQNGDTRHRIHMGTDDEFDEVAHRINRMLDSVRELNDRNTELILLNSKLEMGQLEAQMNPHFLYNTLEIIRNLVMFDAEKAEELIERLVHILRYSVNNSYRDVRLKEDMDYIEDYLYIQNTRFSNRFRCEIDFSDECYACMVPKLLLQPIIENSIKYGFRSQMEVHVRIHGNVEHGILQILVQDDGPGMEADEVKQLSESLAKTMNSNESLGLHNIARRLFLQYGEKSGIEVSSRPGDGFCVKIFIEQQGDSRRCLHV